MYIVTKDDLATIYPQWQAEVSTTDSYTQYATDLLNLFGILNYTKALEIGFENGVSAVAILSCNKTSSLVSIDIRNNIKGIEYLKDPRYCNRHTFINKWSSEFFLENTDTFDLIYIDGDHSYEGCSRDINEAWEVLQDGGWLVIDDTTHIANINGSYGCSLASLQFIEQKQQEIGDIFMSGRLLVIYKLK